MPGDAAPAPVRRKLKRKLSFRVRQSDHLGKEAAAAKDREEEDDEEEEEEEEEEEGGGGRRSLTGRGWVGDGAAVEKMYENDEAATERLSSASSYSRRRAAAAAAACGKNKTKKTKKKNVHRKDRGWRLGLGGGGGSGSEEDEEDAAIAASAADCVSTTSTTAITADGTTKSAYAGGADADGAYTLHADGPSDDLAHSVFRKVFRELDTDGSGALSRREVRAALSSLGLPSTPEFLEPMFIDCDVDKDGVIAFDEFMAYAVRREEELRCVFDDLDSNSDGIIDEHDIRIGLRALGLRASDEKIASLIRKMDQTNDGIITFAEFQAFLMLLPNQTLDETFQTWAKSSRIDLGENMQVPDELSTMSAGDALITFAAGAAAGAVSRTATAPMDRLKVLLQAGPTGGSFTVRTATGPESTIVGGLRAIYGEGGMWAFFRGNGTNVLKIMPESAVKFFAYDWFKRRIARNVDDIQVQERFVAGALAGVTAQTLIYPLEIVKTRLALARRGEYRGITHCLLKTIEADGPRAVFAGLGASCTGIIPYAGIDLCVFMTLKQRWLNNHPYMDEEGPDAITLLGMGAFSSTCGQVVAYPLQLVRTKLQAQGMVGRPQRFSGVLDCVRQTVRANGVKGLYKGIGPNFLKAMPAISISYLVYEKTSRYLKRTFKT
jgi:solute carrier family 25 phosphate transporter 23/24/25/41